MSMHSLIRYMNKNIFFGENLHKKGESNNSLSQPLNDVFMIRLNINPIRAGGGSISPHFSNLHFSMKKGSVALARKQ